MKTMRLLAFVASGASYLLIVLGGWVRITGSGMGCGDDWPLCNGQIIPSLSDTATFIEWSHRLVALGVSALVVGVAVLGYLQRQDPKVSGPGGPLRPAVLALVLMLVQVLLGAITVWLELPATAVILHLGTAMGMVAALLVAGLNAGQHQVSSGWTGAASTWRSAVVALGLAGVAVLMGGLTANMGAAGACMGFPLCNGQIFPTGAEGGLAHIHWLHRLVAYGLALHLIGMAVRAARRKAPTVIRRATMVAMAVTVVQIVVGAGMMLSVLQAHWRVTHVAAGTAVWVAMVVFAWYARPSQSGGTA
jgi:cytochrome c oxidase assembly protein subunit 15